MNGCHVSQKQMALQLIGGKMMLFAEKKHQVLCCREFTENRENSASLKEAMDIILAQYNPKIPALKVLF